VLDPVDSSLNQDLIDQVRSTAAQAYGPGALQAAVPIIFRHMRVESSVVQLFAVPLEQAAGLQELKLIEGQWPEGMLQAAASRWLAQQYGWRAGSRFEMYGRTFTLTGILDSPGRKTFSLWLSYEAGQALFSLQDDFQMALLRMRADVDAQQARAFLEQTPLLTGRYAVYLEEQLNERYTQVTRSLLALTGIINLVALLVITFGAYNAAWLTLSERSREIAMLQVLGFSQRSLRVLLGVRLALLSVASYAVGWGLANWSLSQLKNASSWSIQGVQLVLQLPAQPAALGLGLMTACCLFGAWVSGREQRSANLAVLVRYR
jgi:ABC-type antimicrobial peptide transport system permease subunit